MLAEYALEPEAICRWESFRYFVDAFKMGAGRLIAEFPANWKRLVYDGLADCPDREKHRIIERLASIPAHIFAPRPAASYDASKPWLENAEAEHKRLRFWAILARDNPRTIPHVLETQGLSEGDERWDRSHDRRVSRTPQELAGAVSLLLKIAEHVIFVDPYFRADQDDKRLALAA